MVEPYSQQRSYPENNPHLRLFPARDGVEKSIARFFSPRGAMTGKIRAPEENEVRNTQAELDYAVSR